MGTAYSKVTCPRGTGCSGVKCPRTTYSGVKGPGGHFIPRTVSSVTDHDGHGFDHHYNFLCGGVDNGDYSIA